MNFRANNRELKAFWIVVAILLSSTLFSNLFQASLLEIIGQNHSKWLWVLALIILFFLLLLSYIFASRTLSTVFGSDVKMTPAKTEPSRKVILTGFSKPYPLDEKLFLAKRFVKEIPIEKAVLENDDFNEYVKSEFGESNTKKFQLPWQQNLRAAYHHREKLKDIFVLLPGKNEKLEGEDITLYDAFKIFMEGMLKKADCDAKVSIITEKKYASPFAVYGRSFEQVEPNYEDYDYVYEGMRAGLELAMKKHHVHNSRLSDVAIIDITPGQKIFSIAAAVLTLNLNMKFAYVTNDGTLRFYDASLRFQHK